MKQRLVVNWRVETVRGISGEDNAVQRYVQCVDNIDMSETLAVVILNSPAYAGTTYFGYTNQTKVVEFAIAYCPVIYDLQSESFRQVLVHEAVGHGFAKLEDEYAYQENGTISSKEIKKCTVSADIRMGAELLILHPIHLRYFGLLS